MVAGMSISDPPPDFLTTREVADLLRVKQRRVYDLAASGDLAHTKATGKLLFRRADVERWLGGRTLAPARTPIRRPMAEVVAGSHDPLLDWALRQSGSRLASFFDGSLDGVARMAAGQAVATGLHVYDPAGDDWNIATARAEMPAGAVLMHWARRERGVLSAAPLADLADLAGRRVLMRQESSGSQIHFRHALAEAGVGIDSLTVVDSPARTEAEAAAAIASGSADAAPGILALAREYRLAFLPLARERYDLLIDRRFWFEPAWQALLTFTQSDAFAAKAAAMAGYDVGETGVIRWNGG